MNNFFTSWGRDRSGNSSSTDAGANDDNNPPTHPAIGPITGKKFDIYDGYDDQDSASSYSKTDIDGMLSHMPSQEIYPIDEKDYSVLSAAETARRRRKNIMPNMYANPMQYLDYRIYQTLMRTTFVGSLVDSLVKYIIGSGFKPELELINPDEDHEKNKNEIDRHQDIITKLRRIDDQVSRSDEGHLDTPFRQKIASLITSCLAYNRGALIFDYDHPVEIDGKKYGEIPSNLHYAHAMDLGIITLDPQTRRLTHCQWRQALGSGMIPAQDMIYLWNPVTSSKVSNADFYGISILSPLISATKILRKLLSDDFPAMAENAWAGLFLLVARNDGNTEQSKRDEYSALTTNLTPGKPGVLVKNPEDVAAHNINFNPKVTEFLTLFESMIKLCISTVGLPQVGFYDESAANRATLIGKIQLTMRTNIDPMREWIGESIAAQWYDRWFRVMYKDQPEILEKFRIRLSWDDLHIAEWYDSIEAMLELDGRKEIKDTEFGDKIGLKEYTSMVKPEAETVPGGSGGGGRKMSMTDSVTGDKMEIKTKKGMRN